MRLPCTAAALLCSVLVSASPSQTVFEHPRGPFNPLEHMSGIAPYHDAPGADIRPPAGCHVSAAAFLIRHSSIYANDEEYEEFMEPFISRVEKAKQEGLFSEGNESPVAFLKEWKSLINDDNLEKLTKPGEEDAKEFGKRIRKLYGNLLPPKHLGRKKVSLLRKGKKEKVKTPYKIWTASSERDIGTAKAWIRGAFPSHQEGDGGEGDGKYVSLVEVPNKDPSWSSSLTPHKICPAFSKERGKKEARQWLEVYGPAALARLQEAEPRVGFELDDLVAMAMFCGYESVIKDSRSSPFCSLDIFTKDEWRSFGYYNDLHWHHSIGYGASYSPYLGIGWLTAATHNIVSAYKKPHTHPEALVGALGKKDDDLPGPKRPPNATHTQLLFPFFTHREEPPVALVALGLWNTTSLPPTSMDPARVWHTSHVLPFLGHVALERLDCGDKVPDHVRIIVNGAAQKLPSCQDGPGGSCEMSKFETYVKERQELYGDFEGACKKQEE